MPQTCTRCSRLNPAEAYYCYWDGCALPGHDGDGAAVAASGRHFPNPFVFPSGQTCQSFDELALACQKGWVEAKGLLQQGFLESFLMGMGRADLAMAAREAAAYPDPDRGLDQFIGRLPTGVLQPPKLEVEPLEINLGQMQVGQDRRLEIHLNNLGMRLIYGTMSRGDCGWLLLGESPGARDKLIDFGGELIVPLHVRGERLRASHKPLEGRIVIDTNGGTATINVRVEVPVKPFADGVLAGSRSPRQIAEKSKAALKDAAVLLENGTVAAWYKDNGWAYPVQGPPSSGLGAVQQYFEALGLTPVPKVEISDQAITLCGNAGESLEQTLQVKTQVNRPVWAHGVSDQPWLEVGSAKLNGRVATIPLVIRSVPDTPGQSVKAQVTITSNGNQRFQVPVTLVIGGTPRALSLTLPEMSEAKSEIIDALPAEGAIVEMETVQQLPQQSDGGITLPAMIEEDSKPAEEFPADDQPADAPFVARRRLNLAPLVPLVLAGLLALALGLVILADALTELPEPIIGISFHEGSPDEAWKDYVPPDSMRFGITVLGKPLTFHRTGQTNNVCVRVDGAERLFGQQKPGVWVQRKESTWKDDRGKTREGWKSVWAWDDKKEIVVTQFVEKVPGEQSRVRDTCLVRYLLENRGSKARKIDIRFLLDTCIGTKDGVPFTIPGEEGLCDSWKEFKKAEEVPDFIQVVENEDLANPGTVAHLKLKLDNRDPPSRVVLGAWPDPYLKNRDKMSQAEGPRTLWEVPAVSMKTLWPYDSAVVVYWEGKDALQPGGKREVGFTYGRGTVVSSGRLLMTLDGSFKPNGVFTVTTLLHDPKPDEDLTLILPKGFVLVGGSAQQKPTLPPGATRRNYPVTWKVRAGSVGQYEIKVKSNKGIEQKQKILIRANSILD